MDCWAGCRRAPPILHQLAINAGVKAQSILWCAWPPPGRSSTLKIACRSNFYDIRGNTMFVANCLCFFKSITANSLKFFFDGGGLCFSSPPKKISLKSDTERGKYARFSRLVPFFACLLPWLNGLLSQVLTGTSYSSSTTPKCRI